jgi:predicted DNA binding protein
MMEATFSLKGMGFWLVDLTARHSIPITITECIPWRKSGGQALFTIEQGEADIEKILVSIRSRPDIVSVESLSTSPMQYVGSIAMRDCSWIWKIVDCGCYLSKAWSNGDGRLIIKVLSGSEGSLPRLIKSLSEKGVSVDICKINRMENQSSVTMKQETVLKLAMQRGFFDYPRRIKLKELAELCGMNSATVDEIIKRGERNILERYFKDR